MKPTTAQRVLADTPITLNAERLDALCDLAGIKPGTRIRAAVHNVLLTGASVNSAARTLAIQPASVHAAANRIACAQALIVRATT